MVRVFCPSTYKHVCTMFNFNPFCTYILILFKYTSKLYIPYTFFNYLNYL